MRLIYARVHGYGRLIDSTIKLDQKLISIVGPNEAGKTTLLKALSYTDTGEALDQDLRARATQVDNNTEIVKLHYLLNDEDRSVLNDLDLSNSPKELSISRRAGGKLHIETEPPLRKGTHALREGYALLSEALGRAPSPALHSAESPDVEREEQLVDGTPLVGELNDLASALDQYLAAEGADFKDSNWLLDQASELREQLGDNLAPDSVKAALLHITDWCEAEDPGVEARNRLWNASPDFALFTDKDRSLRSAYTLGAKLLRDVPPALDNLLRLAELDLKTLTDAQEQLATRETLLETANRNLRAHFSHVWKQSDVSVRLRVDGGVLRLFVTEDDLFTSPFAERSQGLRTFVALAAFLSARDTGRPTILLVDEAESHLHIDAQADLIDMFAEQQQAEKVIYTTHSPACLPRDMGVGLRAVVMNGDESSHIENAFWTMEGHGLSPVMFAMGAAAAAFTPARYAVIGEGASDMLLLPSLIRASADLQRLPYQVATGLSEAPKSAFPDLDLEAARVAFVVDGDSGGEALAKKLSQVFPRERIACLPLPGIENALDAQVYRQVFSELLRQRNGSGQTFEFPDFPNESTKSWAKILEDWSQDAGIDYPSKTEVAYRLLEVEPVPLSEIGRAALSKLHSDLVHALNM